MCLKIQFGGGGYRNSVLDRPEWANAQMETHPPQLFVKPSSPSPKSAQEGEHGVTALEKQRLPFFYKMQVRPEKKATVRDNTNLCDRQNEAPSLVALFHHTDRKKRQNGDEGRVKEDEKKNPTLLKPL